MALFPQQIEIKQFYCQFCISEYPCVVAVVSIFFSVILCHFLKITDLTLVYDIALNPSNGDIYFCGNSNDIGGGVIGAVASSSSEISLIFETSSPSTVEIVLDHQSQ